MQEKKEADFRYGLVRVRENAESIAFYGGEGNELQLLLERFRRAFENLSVSCRSSHNPTGRTPPAAPPTQPTCVCAHTHKPIF